MDENAKTCPVSDYAKSDVKDAINYISNYSRRTPKAAQFYEYSKSDLQRYKDVYDAYQETAKTLYQQDSTGFMSEENTRRVNNLKDQRKELQERLKKIDSCIEQAKKLTYAEGDVIFHKDHGPVVVNEIVVNMEEAAWGPVDGAKEPYKYYYKGFSKSGHVVIKAEEALPFNETTKLLYEKAKPKKD